MTASKEDNPMKFGIFGGARVGRADTLHDSHGYRDFIDYVLAAEKIGFEGIFLVEHHFTGQGQLSASLNLLSYLAAKTTRIRLGTGVVVLPWHNPVLLAEQIATLDVLSGGRVDLGIGRGYRKEEFAQFCVPMTEAQERFEECFSLMLKSWSSEERFSYESKRWKYDQIVVEPAPVQRPHPPIWLAGGSPQGIAYVASKNYNLMLDQLATVKQVRERVGAYLDGLEKIGKPRDAARCAIARSVTITKTEAERQKALERRKDTFKRIGAIAVHGTPGSAPSAVSQADPDLASDDSALMGSPQEIVDRIGELADAGAGYILLTMASITPESVQQFAEEILPHVKNLGSQFITPAPQAVAA
jgi:alkanesulfonate monooxygenase SsuD/methylene tetrahydromethanopterin reductase-like flavin-dependent oxidoreductase (luciferase family)